VRPSSAAHGATAAESGHAPDLCRNLASAAAAQRTVRRAAAGRTAAARAEVACSDSIVKGEIEREGCSITLESDTSAGGTHLAAQPSARRRRCGRGALRMEGFYGVFFALLSMVCMVLEWPRASAPGKAVAAAKPAHFTAFRNNYLAVYSLAMGAPQRRRRAPCRAQQRALTRKPRHLETAGDWLQGPYVYALYAAYGFSKGDIGKLFIAGFGSSMVFGTVVGSLGDK
jgi:hypothetical protein